MSDDGADHLITDYVSGPSLHTLAGNSRPPLSEVSRMAIEIADSLATAHQLGAAARADGRDRGAGGGERPRRIADRAA